MAVEKCYVPHEIAELAFQLLAALASLVSIDRIFSSFCGIHTKIWSCLGKKKWNWTGILSQDPPRALWFELLMLDVWDGLIICACMNDVWVGYGYWIKNIQIIYLITELKNVTEINRQYYFMLMYVIPYILVYKLTWQIICSQFLTLQFFPHADAHCIS